MPLLTRDRVNQYSDAVAGGSVPDGLFMRDVKDFIEVVGREDTPLASIIKVGDSSKHNKREYGEGDLAPRTITVTAAALSTDLSLTVDDRSKVQAWDVLYNPTTDERIRLGAADPGQGAGALAVAERGVGSSNPAAIAINQVLTILGPAVPEGADSPKSPIARGTLKFTFHQIFEYTWDYTHRGRVTPNYEVKSDQFKHQLKKKMREAALDLDLTLLHGVKQQGDGSATNPSMLGGLREATTTNVTSLASNVALSMYDIVESMQAVSNDVGPSNVAREIMLHPTSKRIVNSFFEGDRRGSFKDAKFNSTIDEVDTDFGPVKFLLNHNMNKNELIAIRREDMSRHAYEGGNWQTGMLSTQGWYDKGFLRGDYCGVFEADRRRFAIKGYSVAKADYPGII